MPLIVNRSWAATCWLRNECMPEETIMRDTLIPTFNRNPGQCPTVSGPVETERADVYFRSMEAPNVDFTLSRLERVISGPGKIATLGEELERRGLERGIVVTGKSLGSSRLLEEVTGALGTRCAAVFKGAKQHV